MADYNVSPTRTATAPAIEINKVLRNTYMLLGLTLAFSALMAYAAMAVNAPYLGLWTLLGWFGLLYAIHKTANSAWGIFWVFAFTGFLGFTIGPVIEFYLQAPNGSDVVGMALGSTAVAFVGLSVFALTTRKDFSFLSGFLTVGIIALFGIVLLSWVFDLSAFMGAIGGAVVLLMSGLILWQTSAIIHGGQTNYILATTTLYMSIYNMFSWLLLLIGMGDD
ncbi:MAG: Bax inhibitor-1/YccA family protein [Gammaproteobacteria bacterium]|nr:Bax inhibitor-1/YccA family protein [Gammaproteobacteria bacterium]